MSQTYRLQFAIPIVASLIAMMLSGCTGDEVEMMDHHEFEHRPPDYTTATVRLAELHEEIVSGSMQKNEEGEDEITESYDIVRWLPNLAADSDLAEPYWNRINESSESLLEILDEVMVQDEVKRRDSYLRHESKIEDLQRELLQVSQESPHPNARDLVKEYPNG